jgi:hypothetical protein
MKAPSTDVGAAGLNRTRTDLKAVGERAPDVNVPSPPAHATLMHPGGPLPKGAEPLKGRVRLVVEQGQIIGEQYLLTETEMILGRIDPYNDIYPDIDLSAQDSEYVHREHARIQFHDMHTRISIEHIGGQNRTLVNNKPILKGEMVEIKLEDRVRIGRVVMRLKAFG